MAEELEQEQQQEGEPSEEEVQEASEMGWSPKDKWRGKEEDWVDARTFLERGKKVLPIVTAQNRELRQNLRELNQRMTPLERELAATKAALEAIEADNEETAQRELVETRDSLQSELEAALRDGDHKLAAKLSTDIAKLGDIDEQPKKRRGEDTLSGGGQDNLRVSPEVAQWFADNPDYQGRTRKAALGAVIADELRARGVKVTGPAFLNMVAEEVDRSLGENGTQRPNRVNGGNGGSGRRGGGGGGGGEKTYADLPAEAKAACDKMAPKLVGEGKRHKDVASWRASYTRQFFRGEQR